MTVAEFVTIGTTVLLVAAYYLGKEWAAKDETKGRAKMRNVHKGKNYVKVIVGGKPAEPVKRSSPLDARCEVCGEDAGLVYSGIGKNSGEPKHLCHACFSGRD